MKKFLLLLLTLLLVFSLFMTSCNNTNTGKNDNDDDNLGESEGNGNDDQKETFPEEDGDYITFSVEGFTVGIGYIVAPVNIKLVEGENTLQKIIECIESQGLTVDYSGTPESGFYLKSIGKIDLSNATPEQKIKDAVASFGEIENSIEGDKLGEYSFWNFSGWMYSVNGEIPSVGLSDYVFKSGDCVRLCFSLAYGSDIAENGFFGMKIPDEYADYSQIMQALAKYRIAKNKTVYNEVLNLAGKYNVTTEELTNLVARLKNHYEG